MKADLCSKKFASLSLAAMLMLGISTISNAQEILFDLGRDSGPIAGGTDFRSISVPNPDPNGHYWNSVSSCCYYSNVQDKNGGATSIGFGFVSASGNDSYNGPAGPTDPPPMGGTDWRDWVPFTTINAAALGDLGVKEAAFDFYTNGRMTIDNLDPSKTYTLSFFGSHQFNGDNDTTVYASYTDNTYTTAVASTNLVIGGNGFWNEDQVATLSNLTPQGTTLYIGFRGAAPLSLGYLNAFKLTVVPEPGSVLLLLSGAVASAITFRRRK